MSRTKKILFSLVMAAILSAGAFFYAAPAVADLMIMPVRVVFKDRDRMKSITLANTSEKEAIFRFSFYHQKQNENGSYTNLPEAPGPYDLSKMLIFSPRQVDLPARGKQAVRLSVRRPENIPDGEYRTHMRMQRLSGNAESSGRGGPAVGVAINVGFSIPVMLRKGTYDSTAKISNFKFIPSPDGAKPAKVRFDLNRTGKYSTLGRVLIFWTPVGGKEQQVGIRNSVNIFPEINVRHMDIDLQDAGISGGKLRVIFEGDDADEGIKFDEKSFQL